MRRTFVIAAGLVLALAIMLPAFGGLGQRNFRAHLTGAEEVPAVETRSQGQVTFKLNVSGTALDFKLITANILNVTQAHIHCGADGVNGPIVAFLYPDGPPAVLIEGRSDGVLNEGTITAAQVIPLPADPTRAACPDGLANFDELIAKMRAGETYTNVHTTAVPSGQIRGQNR